MNKDVSGKKFNLRRFFTLSSVVAVVIITMIMSYLFISHQKRILVDYAVIAAQEFAHQVNHRLYDDGLVSKIQDRDKLVFEPGSLQYESINNIVDVYLMEFTDVVKLKIFDESGLTIFSTDETNIGIVNTSERFQKASVGEIATHLTRKMQPLEDESTEVGKLYSVDLLEVYVPIYTDEADMAHDGKVIGAFEVYKDMTPVFDKANREGYVIFFIFILLMSALFFILQVIIRKADTIIKEQTEEIENTNMDLEAANESIRESIDQVIENESFSIRYDKDNEKLLKCWEYKDCGKTDCPSYKADDLRCWQVAGTFCGGKVQGQFARKFGDCRKCEVYKNAFKGRIDKIGESFNNMMTLLESKHEKVEELNERLNELIDIDPLTQIGNRRSFQKEIVETHLRSLRYDHYYSIVICDIDNFKLYNDTYGHQKGDDVLISVANTLKGRLRKTDMVFRWGGEEFVIILPEQKLPQTIFVAETVREAVQSLKVEHKENSPEIVTISCGVACRSIEDESDVEWESILKRADDELYKAKGAGRNCVSPKLES